MSCLSCGFLSISERSISFNDWIFTGGNGAGMLKSEIFTSLSMAGEDLQLVMDWKTMFGNDLDLYFLILAVRRDLLLVDCFNSSEVVFWLSTGMLGVMQPDETNEGWFWCSNIGWRLGEALFTAF